MGFVDGQNSVARLDPVPKSSLMASPMPNTDTGSADSDSVATKKPISDMPCSSRRALIVRGDSLSAAVVSARSSIVLFTSLK